MSASSCETITDEQASQFVNTVEEFRPELTASTDEIWSASANRHLSQSYKVGKKIIEVVIVEDDPDAENYKSVRKFHKEVADQAMKMIGLDYAKDDPTIFAEDNSAYYIVEVMDEPQTYGVNSIVNIQKHAISSLTVISEEGSRPYYIKEYSVTDCLLDEDGYLHPLPEFPDYVQESLQRLKNGEITDEEHSLVFNEYLQNKATFEAQMGQETDGLLTPQRFDIVMALLKQIRT